MARRRTTSLEVAKEAGVSRTTVSLVMNNRPQSGIPSETRRRVLDAATRLNYHPNVSGRRLASGRTFTIAFVIHQSPERAAADLFLPQVLRGLNAYLRLNGYHILFRPVDPKNAQDGYAYLIYEGHVDGVILSGPQLEESDAVALHSQGLPIVLTGRLPGHNVPFVDADNYQGAQLATNHLVSLGHRRIGFITNAPVTYVASQERFRGYQDSLVSADLFYEPELMVEGYFTSESGFRAMDALLDLSQIPTAVFVASDVVAYGAIQAVKRRGLDIPDDLAIVGFDDVSVSQYIQPFLTTIRLPAYDLGWNAGQLSLEQINGEVSASNGRLLPTELVVRASCGAMQQES